MSQPDQLELALAELERLRDAQDADLQAAFATYAHLGDMLVDVDVDELRRLSECSEYKPCRRQAAPNRLAIQLQRC